MKDYEQEWDLRLRIRTVGRDPRERILIFQLPGCGDANRQ